MTSLCAGVIDPAAAVELLINDVVGWHLGQRFVGLVLCCDVGISVLGLGPLLWRCIGFSPLTLGRVLNGDSGAVPRYVSGSRDSLRW